MKSKLIGLFYFLLVGLLVRSSNAQSQPSQPNQQKSILLKDLPSTELSCKFKVPNAFPGGRCKAVFEDDKLIFYIEVGGRQEELGNQRATQAIVIPLNNIFAITTKVWKNSQFYRNRSNSQVYGYIGFITDELPSGNRTNFLDFEKINTDPNKLSLGALDQARLNWLKAQKNSSLQRTQLIAKLQSPLGSMPPQNLSELTKQVLSTRTCIRCDLRGANLEGADLNKANLEGVNLTGAKLKGAKLEDANLIGAILDNADLSNTSLSFTRLSLASMQRSKLTNSTLDRANLESTDLSYANLDQASLNPEHAFPVDLTGANLSYTSMIKTSLNGAVMIFTNFQDANLKQAIFNPVTVSGQNFQHKTVLNLANFQRADLTEAQLRSVSIINSNFQDSNLSRANLRDGILWNINFQGANLTETIIENTSLWNVNLQNAIMTKTRLTNSRFCETTMSDGSVSNKGCHP